MNLLSLEIIEMIFIATRRWDKSMEQTKQEYGTLDEYGTTLPAWHNPFDPNDSIWSHWILDEIKLKNRDRKG